MEIKTNGKSFFGGEKYKIGLEKGDSIIVRLTESETGYTGHIEIACDSEGRLSFTTNYTQSMGMYSLIKGSQKLLGIPPKRCKCGDERGGFPHLHPINIPFELED